MKDKKQRLVINQVDSKISEFSSLSNVEVPGRGWIHTVRTALKMSLRQFGDRLGINISSARDIEQREVDGAITLKSLRYAASALNMQLVYGLIPRDGSLEAMIKNRAEEVATKIVMRTSHSMALEDQKNSEERLRNAIKELADELRYELPRSLWDLK